MNGPEHYQEAEKLLRAADQATDPTQIEGGWEATDDPKELDTREYLMASARLDAAQFVAQAQVHATLALAASQIDAAVVTGAFSNGSDVVADAALMAWAEAMKP